MQSLKNGGGNESDERKRKQIMGSWLSLTPSRIHACHFCKECFSSLRALLGHQSTHRVQQTQLNNMHRTYLTIQERGRKDTPSSSVTPSTKRARNNNTDDDANGIDLDLRLGSDSPVPKMKKVMRFYDFLGVKDGKGNGGVHAPSGSGVNKKINEGGDAK